MRRIFLVTLLIAFSNPASAATILSGTPASVELENLCPHQGGDESQCRQAVANMAQTYCAKHGRNAQYVRAAPKGGWQLSGVTWWFLYNCVR